MLQLRESVTGPRATCACCGGSKLLTLGRSYGRWRYVKCKSCETFQLHPRPTAAELDKFYNSEYQVDSERHFRQMSAIGNELLDLLESKVKGRELLEIGCSYGGFLRAAQLRNWSCVGVEISREAANVASQAGLNVSVGTLEQNWGHLCGANFDAVVLWHVIEHLPNWRAVLGSVAKLLKSGGCLALRTPNAASLGAWCLGSGWEWFHAPDHLQIFSPRALERILEELGFKIEFVGTQRGDANTLVSQVMTALASRALRAWRRVPSKFEYRANSSSPRLRRWHYHACRVLNSLGRPVDSLLGVNGGTMRGSELLAMARRV